VPVTGLQFSGAHKVCAIGGFIPVIGAALNLFGSKRFYQREIDYLRERGYTFESADNGLWQAIRKK
jgi:hypothetical protein